MRVSRIFMLAVVFFAVIGLSIEFFATKREVSVNCYDRHNRLIEDLTCVKVTHNFETLSGLIAISTLLCTLFFIVFALYEMAHNE